MLIRCLVVGASSDADHIKRYFGNGVIGVTLCLRYAESRVTVMVLYQYPYLVEKREEREIFFSMAPQFQWPPHQHFIIEML